MIPALPRRTRARPVSAINPDSKKEFHFLSIREAAKAVGCSATAIHRALEHPEFTARGYHWRRDDFDVNDMEVVESENE